MPKETTIDSVITTFRILPEDKAKLEEKLPNAPSHHKRARKVVTDFARGKLVYTDKNAAQEEAGSLKD